MDTSPPVKIKFKNRPFRPRLPEFLKQPIPSGPAFQNVQSTIGDFRLNTVCEEAKCPNRTHCYARGTLTFQILGDVCTRSCGFCGEAYGKIGRPVEALEAERVVSAAARLKLTHVVITSPARDDLPDQGAGQFARVVNAFHEKLPEVTVEILTPDFQADPHCLETVFKSKPDVFNHNIETVRRLTSKVRSKATYDRTLHVLHEAKKFGLLVKSGLMVGHGETEAELIETFQDLSQAGCEMVTLGQYLPPSPHHLPLERVYLPREFDALKERALAFGFKNVEAGPLVRSSYHADESMAKSSTPSR